MAALPTRQLGKNGPIVPALGFGLMGLSAYAGETLPDGERFKVLDRAYELGETFWDSAEVYVSSSDDIMKHLLKTWRAIAKNL